MCTSSPDGTSPTAGETRSTRRWYNNTRVPASAAHAARAVERARCVHVRLPVPCLRSLSPRRACRPRAVPVCPAGWGRGRGTRTAWCCGALGVCACACGVWSGHVRCVRCCACGGARAVGSRVGRVWCWCWCCACSLACVVCACGAGRSGRVALLCPALLLLPRLRRHVPSPSGLIGLASAFRAGQGFSRWGVLLLEQ